MACAATMHGPRGLVLSGALTQHHGIGLLDYYSPKLFEKLHCPPPAFN